MYERINKADIYVTIVRFIILILVIRFWLRDLFFIFEAKIRFASVPEKFKVEIAQNGHNMNERVHAMPAQSLRTVNKTRDRQKLGLSSSAGTVRFPTSTHWWRAQTPRFLAVSRRSRAWERRRPRARWCLARSSPRSPEAGRRRGESACSSWCRGRWRDTCSRGCACGGRGGGGGGEREKGKAQEGGFIRFFKH